MRGVSSVAQAVAQVSRQPTQLLRTLCTSRGPLLDEDTDIHDADYTPSDQSMLHKELQQTTGTDVKDSQPSSAQGESTLTIEQERFSKEKDIRQKHFQSDFSKRLLDIANYSGKLDVEFESKRKFEDFLELNRSNQYRSLEEMEQDTSMQQGFGGPPKRKLGGRYSEDDTSDDDDDDKNSWFNKRQSRRKPLSHIQKGQDFEPSDDGESVSPRKNSSFLAKFKLHQDELELRRKERQRSMSGLEKLLPDNVSEEAQNYNFGLPGLGKRSREARSVTQIFVAISCMNSAV